MPRVETRTEDKDLLCLDMFLLVTMQTELSTSGPNGKSYIASKITVEKEDF